MRVLCITMLIWLSAIGSSAWAFQTHSQVLPGFTSYTVKAGDTWESMTKNERDKALAMRINRMNIEPRAGTQIVLPANRRAHDYVPVPGQIRSTNRHLVIYKDLQYFGAYENGQLVYWGPVSTGKSGNTPVGNYRALWKDRYHRSSLYNNSRMYFAVQFKGNFFTHEYKKLPGYPASAGCVRMFWSDAEWKFGWIKEGDKITVTDNASSLAV